MLLAHISDTHVVRPGATYFARDTARDLRDALEALNALAPQPDLVAVTGDLVNFGRDDEYERFVTTMATLRLPWIAIPGNHDDRDRMRVHLPPESFGYSRDSRIRFARDVGGVRLLGLDATPKPSFPRAAFDADSLAWLERELAAHPDAPTIVLVHQPPFRTGLHYLDVFGYGLLRRFRRAIVAHPNVGLVLSGHIHCVRRARIGAAVAISAPSTTPQVLPELFERRAFGLRRETAGFALHAWDAAGGFRTTIYRRDADARGPFTPRG